MVYFGNSCTAVKSDNFNIKFSYFCWLISSLYNQDPSFTVYPLNYVLETFNLVATWYLEELEDLVDDEIAEVKTDNGFQQKSSTGFFHLSV